MQGKLHLLNSTTSTSIWTVIPLDGTIEGTTEETNVALETTPEITNRVMVMFLLAQTFQQLLTLFQNKAKADHARHDATAGTSADALHHEVLQVSGGHRLVQIEIETFHAAEIRQRADLHSGVQMIGSHLTTTNPMILDQTEVESSRKSKRTPKWKVASRMRTKTRP